VVIGITFRQAGAAAPIVIKPLAGKSGAHKILVVVNGAFVPNDDYVDVAKAIQSATDLNLWVAIPSFIINTPNPGEIDSKIKGSISALESAGFPGTARSDVDVVVGGHSLGGIFSQTAVAKGNYAGLVLFGSYLSSINGYAVNTYPKPALTLAGELDGLTRITRIAKSWLELKDLRDKEGGEDARFTHPVVALPGVTHSQFCSNTNVTSFGMKDKCPEVSLADAHSLIGSTVSSFLSVVFNSGDVAGAKAKLDSGLKYTEQLVSGYLQAFEITKQGNWCARAQQQEALLAKTDGTNVSVEMTSNFASFDSINPSIDGDKVKVVQELQYKLNPTDLSTMDFSAQEIDCKINTAAALAKAFGKATPTQESNTCRSWNDQAIDIALKLVTTKTRDRYLNSGAIKRLTTKDDVVYSTGVTWQAASFTFDTSSASVVSPRLTATLKASLWPGEQLCKYLAPDRVIEYMMVDGLPAFDACPQTQLPVDHQNMFI
jgi:hypothetical protein